MSKKRICLDTSAWQAIINEERTKDLESLEAVIELVNRGRAVLMVPSIVICECFCHPDHLKLNQFEQALLRTGVEQIDISSSIAKAAGILRRQVLNDGRKLKTPDAIIIAAAHQHQADFILSFDETDIVRLNGRYGLAPQIGLPSIAFEHPLFE